MYITETCVCYHANCSSLCEAGVTRSAPHCIVTCANETLSSAAVALEKRGLGSYIGNIHSEPMEPGFRAQFSQHPLCKGFENRPFPTFNEKPCRIEKADGPASDRHSAHHAGKTLRSVTVVNSTIGPQKDVKLILRNVPEKVKTAKWIVPAEPVKELPVQRGAEISVTIPELAPWGIGFIEL